LASNAWLEAPATPYRLDERQPQAPTEPFVLAEILAQLVGKKHLLLEEIKIRQAQAVQ
jgi:hypothetical protein